MSTFADIDWNEKARTILVEGLGVHSKGYDPDKEKEVTAAANVVANALQEAYEEGQNDGAEPAVPVAHGGQPSVGVVTFNLGLEGTRAVFGILAILRRDKPDSGDRRMALDEGFDSVRELWDLDDELERIEHGE